MYSLRAEEPESESEVIQSCPTLWAPCFLASSFLLVDASNPWHSLACHCLTFISVSIITRCSSLCVSASLHVFLTAHIGLGPH